MPATQYYAVIRGELLHGSLKELSEYYCEIRDESGEGCSTFFPVEVRIAGTTDAIGYISYNGRVWDGRLWNGLCDFTDNAKLLYDNRKACEVVITQQTADEALARWQELRAAGHSPGDRLEILMREFFAPPSPLDCEFNAIQREVTAIMEAA